MSTPTTTEVAILEALAAQIIGLTPTDGAQGRFERMSPVDLKTPDFRDYAEANAQTCLRWFEIEASGWETMDYSNLDIERRRTVIDIVVAYPHTWGKYTAFVTDYTKRMQALRAMLAQDMSQIQEVVGINGRANYPDGAFPIEMETVEVPELGDGVTFGAVTIPCEYFFDTNA